MTKEEDKKLRKNCILTKETKKKKIPGDGEESSIIITVPQKEGK